MKRLTAVGDSGYSRSFNYDAWGNMWVTGNSGVTLAGNTPTSDVFTASNQISGTSYDAGGNQLSVNGDTVAYDAENRQVSATDNVTHAVETYVYDGAGQRVEKSGPNGTAVYVYDVFGSLSAEYSTAAAHSPCTTCYLSYDHLGSVRMVTDQNGSVVARHDYLPSGEEIPGNVAGRYLAWGPWGSTTDVEQRFTGQFRDTETGIDFFNARYFGAALGRFTSPDPYNAGADPTDPQTWNGYAYVRNNPLALTDPTGMILDAPPNDPFGGCWDPYDVDNDYPCWGGGAGWGGNPTGGGGGGGARGGSGSGGSSTPVPLPTNSGLWPPGSFPGGENLGLPPGMGIPGPLSPQVLLGLWGWDCPAGICVPGLAGSVSGGGSPDVQIKSLYDNIIEHLEKLAANPNDPAAEHWVAEIRGWVNQILRKAGKTTLKRQPGALDKYLQRLIGITGSDLENLLPSPIIVVNPCAIRPTLPFCPGASPIGAASTL